MVLRKVAKSYVVKAIHFCSKRIFGRYLLITNISISTISSGIGDIVRQHYDILSGDKSNWEKNHTKHMAITGISTGVILHFWYLHLDRWMPGKTLKLAVQKSIIDQIIYSPINLVVFFGTVGLLEKSTHKCIHEEVFQKGWRVYLTEWYIWPPAQVINFYFVPLKYRMLFDSLISFGFDIYISYVKYKHEMVDVPATATYSKTG